MRALSPVSRVTFVDSATRLAISLCIENTSSRSLFVVIRPDVLLAVDLDELRRHSDLIAGLSYASLQNEGDLEFVPDLRDALARPLIEVDRSPRDHPESFTSERVEISSSVNPSAK